MTKAKRLQEKSMFLRLILENYSIHNQEVAKLLDRMRPLFDKIESHQIEPPILGEYNVFDFSVEHHKYNTKYPIISRASAHFASVLEDWDDPFPADERDTNALLKERVQPFITTLSKYAKDDQYAQMLLTEINPLLTDINNNNLRPPIANTHNWWFTDKASPLFNKYLDLTEAAILFDGYLEDEWFLSVNRERFLASL
ncbi:hypothetical protein [Leptothrix ochracea]|uniref:hypothetical protein n=1 Tax=Leptothrix ochracea TaxID=735331 RepID=UPI0034E2B7C1